jgi:hypothetical protein
MKTLLMPPVASSNSAWAFLLAPISHAHIAYSRLVVSEVDIRAARPRQELDRPMHLSLIRLEPDVLRLRRCQEKENRN